VQRHLLDEADVLLGVKQGQPGPLRLVRLLEIDPLLEFPLRESAGKAWWRSGPKG
jgi:hypothetical protein